MKTKLLQNISSIFKVVNKQKLKLKNIFKIKKKNCYKKIKFKLN